MFHGLLFVIFYKAVNTAQSSDQMVSLAVYLLELALSVTDAIGSNVKVKALKVKGEDEFNYLIYFPGNVE